MRSFKRARKQTRARQAAWEEHIEQTQDPLPCVFSSGGSSSAMRLTFAEMPAADPEDSYAQTALLKLAGKLGRKGRLIRVKENRNFTPAGIYRCGPHIPGCGVLLYGDDCFGSMVIEQHFDVLEPLDALPPDQHIVTMQEFEAHYTATMSALGAGRESCGDEVTLTDFPPDCDPEGLISVSCRELPFSVGSDGMFVPRVPH